jgi:hypothetical protein
MCGKYNLLAQRTLANNSIILPRRDALFRSCSLLRLIKSLETKIRLTSNVLLSAVIEPATNDTSPQRTRIIYVDIFQVIKIEKGRSSFISRRWSFSCGDAVIRLVFIRRGREMQNDEFLKPPLELCSFYFLSSFLIPFAAML